MATGALNCVKYLLFVFNFIFWLAGTAVLAVGLWLRFDERTKGLFANEEQRAFFTGVYILIVAGAIMMVVGFLGCCGAIKESTCLLGLFFICLLVIFAIEVAAGIWGLSNQETIITGFQKFYTETYDNYIRTKQEALKETLRAIQFGLQCCGKTGLVGGAFDGAPETCPKQTGLEAFVTTSCPDAIKDAFTTRFKVIGGVGIGIGLIMIFGMIFSMLLCCAIRKSGVL